jgi:hypothetical protein
VLRTFDPGRRFAIVNIASVLAFHPWPEFSVRASRRTASRRMDEPARDEHGRYLLSAGLFHNF